MTKTLHATYDGQVLRPEEPIPLPPNTRVQITITTEPGIPAPRRMVFGQFSGPGMSTEEDFRIAEWRGESETNNGD